MVGSGGKNHGLFISIFRVRFPVRSTIYPFIYCDLRMRWLRLLTPTTAVYLFSTFVFLNKGSKERPGCCSKPCPMRFCWSLSQFTVSQPRFKFNQDQNLYIGEKQMDNIGWDRITVKVICTILMSVVLLSENTLLSQLYVYRVQKHL